MTPASSAKVTSFPSLSVKLDYRGARVAMDPYHETRTGREAEAAAQDVELVLLRDVVDGVDDGVLVLGGDGRSVRLANDRFAEMWSIPGAVFQAADDAELARRIDDQIVGDAAFEAATRAPVEGIRETLELIDGRVFEGVAHERRRPGAASDWAWTFRDITEHVIRARALEHRALHDELTLLPNRGLFIEHLAVVLARVARSGSKAVVMFIDLDDFKNVNDTFGHQMGDRVLREIARRLRATLRLTDTVARFGGDEFAIVCDVDGDREISTLTARVQQALEAPLDLDGPITLRSSVGIAISGERDADPDSLVQEADAAMYRAKMQRGTVAATAPPVPASTEPLSEAPTDRELREAFHARELHLYYQPIVDVRTHAILGFEALLRWHRSSGESVHQAAEFINVAEQTGLIVEIGEWALHEACRSASAWTPLASEGLPLVSVNISPVQLIHPEFTATVERALEETGLEPHRLALEIGERALVKRGSDIESALSAIADSGVRIVVDDFGRQYAPLTGLSRFRAYGVKLDGAFIESIDVNPDASAMLNAVVALGAHLDLKVTAEHVERPRQLRELELADCDMAQGYLLGAPVPHDTATEMLTQGTLDISLDSDGNGRRELNGTE